MARISYVNPDDVDDPEIRQWLEESERTGWPGPEPLHIRAHSPVVMRSEMYYRLAMRDQSVVERELRELVRVRVSTLWDRMFDLGGCHY